jgi:hypothetical protein
MQFDLADADLLGAINYAAKQGHAQALFELLKDFPLPDVLEALKWPDDVAVESVEALIEAMLQSVRPKILLPTRHPALLNDQELERQNCVVAMAGCQTFACLPLKPVEAEALLLFDPEKNFAATTEFDFTQLQQADLPFLPGWRLILLPHAQQGFAVPFVINEQQLILAQTVNEWLYSLMETSAAAKTPENFIAYAHFFFAVIVGQLGFFLIVDDVAQIPWLPAANEDDKAKVQALLTPLRYLGVGIDGRQELRGTIVFKNALFLASILIDRNWQTEFAKEQLLIEELPISHSRAEGLFVRDTSLGPISALDRSRANRLVLPSQCPRDLSEQEVVAQNHVVALAGCKTFARLPLQELIDFAWVERFRFEDWIANIAEFDLERLRFADLPFLPGWQLILLPHRQANFEFPLVISGERLIMPQTQNEWLYSLMESTQAEKTPEILKSYTYFFFSVIVGQLGFFNIVDSAEQILWDSNATEADHDKVKPHLSSPQYLGIRADGRHELRGSIVFKMLCLFPPFWCRILGKWS